MATSAQRVFLVYGILIKQHWFSARVYQYLLL